MQDPFKKKPNIGISILFFCKFLLNKGLSQNVRYKFHLEIGLANPIMPGGPASQARMTKLTAANQKPLTLWCPNFVPAFSFYLWDMFWPNFSKSD